MLRSCSADNERRPKAQRAAIGQPSPQGLVTQPETNFFGARFPALAGWANLSRAVGAQDGLMIAVIGRILQPGCWSGSHYPGGLTRTFTAHNHGNFCPDRDKNYHDFIPV